MIGAALASRLPGGWLAVALLALATTLPVIVMVRGMGGASYPGRWMRLLVLRPFWYAQLLVPLGAVATLAGVLPGALVGAPGAGGRIALATFAILAAIVLLLGYRDARRLVVRRLVARHPLLPPAFEGLRIAQLSDVHAGPHTSRAHLARAAAMVRDARPDLVVITGDLVDDYAADVEHFVAGLGPLAAPLGTYAIAGNHDVYAGWGEVRRRLEAHGITVLVNEARELVRDGARIVLVGTGDPAGRAWSRAGGTDAAPDIDRAMADARRRAPDAPYVLALAHNPALWPALARHGVALTLSGHTHWGQLAFPRRGWSLASAFLAHAMGAYVEGTSTLWVHPGTNYWGIPFRLGTPPEVAIVTLSRGDSGITENPVHSPL